MSYTKTSWVNGQAPAISADNLNKIENKLYSLDSDVSSLNTSVSNLDTNKLAKAAVKTSNTTSNSDTYSCTFSNEHFGGKELYNNTSGSKQQITLNETSANFTYLEIYGNASGVYTCIRVYSPNGKEFAPQVYYLSGTLAVLIVSKYNISGNKITPDTTQCGYITVNNSGASNFNYDQTNYFYINKVVGYK